MFERLRVVPFVESEGDGLHMHDLAQQAIDASVRVVDPSRYQAYRRAAWWKLNEEIQKASQRNLWRYTAKLLYLIENPAVREAFFPSGGQQSVVEAARAEDGAAIQEISRRHEALSAASRLAELWWSNPQIFRVVREQSDAIAGFYCMFDPTTVSSDDLETDPMSQQWRRHLRGNSAPKNKRALFIRRWLSREHGEAPSPVQAACWLDINRSYDALRCRLSRPHRCRKLTIVVPLPANQLARWPSAVWLSFSSLSSNLSAMIRDLAGIA